MHVNDIITLPHTQPSISHKNLKPASLLMMLLPRSTFCVAVQRMFLFSLSHGKSLPLFSPNQLRNLPAAPATTSPTTLYSLCGKTHRNPARNPLPDSTQT